MQKTKKLFYYEKLKEASESLAFLRQYKEQISESDYNYSQKMLYTLLWETQKKAIYYLKLYSTFSSHTENENAINLIFKTMTNSQFNELLSSKQKVAYKNANISEIGYISSESEEYYFVKFSKNLIAMQYCDNPWESTTSKACKKEYIKFL